MATINGGGRLREIAREIQAAGIALGLAMRGGEGYAWNKAEQRCNTAANRISELVIQRQFGFVVRDTPDWSHFTRRSLFKNGRLLATILYEDKGPDGMPYPRRGTVYLPKRLPK